MGFNIHSCDEGIFPELKVSSSSISCRPCFAMCLVVKLGQAIFKQWLQSSLQKIDIFWTLSNAQGQHKRLWVLKFIFLGFELGHQLRIHPRHHDMMVQGVLSDFIHALPGLCGLVELKAVERAGVEQQRYLSNTGSRRPHPICVACIATVCQLPSQKDMQQCARMEQCEGMCTCTTTHAASNAAASLASNAAPCKSRDLLRNAFTWTAPCTAQFLGFVHPGKARLLEYLSMQIMGVQAQSDHWIRNL